MIALFNTKDGKDFVDKIYDTLTIVILNIKYMIFIFAVSREFPPGGVGTFRYSLAMALRVPTVFSAEQ
jgi:hypothetical protein